MPGLNIASSSSCSYKTAREVLSCSDSPDKSLTDIMENNVEHDDTDAKRIQEVRELLTTVSAGREYNLYFVQSVRDDVHWVCMLSPHTQKIQSLIHNSVRRQMSKEDLQKVQVGDNVIARWSDFCLYRGRIEKIMSSDKFRVRFLDFGNMDSVTGSALYFHIQALDSIPYQAFTCKFSDKRRKKKKFFDKWKIQDCLCYIDSLDWDQIPNAQEQLFF
ncbi:staphylococcal nuclease domain-containing protein 1 [Eurytemora carolleeae]|uniref:staphylococcal nuclease domain-containing protein 1 n=1 Tax=Eurytemora carolleeae TaxID=1294199 RepID=UPI000C76174A|nr:staphylococcal nuclease domain-containing protein 1 [Eurytemora carolleeae]|eukprot:XP_023329969.1 staphylococcal nuclease domain-containing protein 1-like [Eurytemora affinis]